MRRYSPGDVSASVKLRAEGTEGQPVYSGERRLIAAILLRARLDCGEIVINGIKQRHAGNRANLGRNIIEFSETQQNALKWVRSRSTAHQSLIFYARLLGWSDAEIETYRADCERAALRISAEH